MQIVIINGRGGCGKDTFVELCAKQVGRYMCFNVSTIDAVKNVARHCGWEGGKEDRDRKFLSDLKVLMTEYNDYPHLSVINHIKLFEGDLDRYDLNPDKAIVFIHCREPEAIERLKQELNAKTLLIRRPSLEGHDYGNSSDDGVDNYDYDYVVDNDGGLDVFGIAATKFLVELGFSV